jgi:hypothetical protein
MSIPSRDDVEKLVTKNRDAPREDRRCVAMVDGDEEKLCGKKAERLMETEVNGTVLLVPFCAKHAKEVDDEASA